MNTISETQQEVQELFCTPLRQLSLVLQYSACTSCTPYPLIVPCTARSLIVILELESASYKKRYKWERQASF